MIKKKHIKIAVCVIIVTALLIILANPLRRSTDRIRDNILKLTPVGMSMEETIRIVESKKKWELYWISNKGYGMFRGSPGEYYFDITKEIAEHYVVGVKSIRVHLGDYFRTGVLAYWGFDEDDKLVDVAVRKDIDGP